MLSKRNPKDSPIAAAGYALCVFAVIILVVWMSAGAPHPAIPVGASVLAIIGLAFAIGNGIYLRRQRRRG